MSGNSPTPSVHEVVNDPSQPSPTPVVPSRPKVLPFPATTDNVQKLEEYLLDQFSTTTFARRTPFPTMVTSPAHIHLKPDATPHARHVPIPIPIHWKDEVKLSLDNDVKNGIIEPVPIGEPVEWCSTMVVVQKPDGRPRRTVDLQKLNAQCQRETHHCQSPFQLACQVPPHTKKTVLDAVDGFHAVLLDEESRCLTTFITEWGRYRYLRLPQGYLAAGDAYTRRYDEIIKDVPRKVKCVDDALLYDDSIESAFYHTWDYLTLCAEKGIVISRDKFKFCKDTVTFAGLKLTPTGITPSDHILSAIRDFPTPKDLTGARSWFGLVNQIAWAYSISPIMQPFRELVKKNSTFVWDDTLQSLFDRSKQLIMDKVVEGIQAFDTSRNTCLQTDWSKSKDGIGYLLLQQHCNCPMTNAPVCCPEGWKLVYAGSRFTHDAETRYSPTEGEALAVTWSLEHSRMFILGCEKLMISTDHKPLLGIFGDRELASVVNPRIRNLKEKTLRYQFSIQHNPGKWHRGPDAISRNPTDFTSVNAIHNTILEHATTYDIACINDREENMLVAVLGAIDELNVAAVSNTDRLISLDTLQRACADDTTYQKLVRCIQDGFPPSKTATDSLLKEFWEVRDRLTTSGDIALLDKRIVIPVAYRKQVLNTLHSAHQGISGMQARANLSVYWPGMNSSIRNTRYTCQRCNDTAPSQSKEPLILTPTPTYPFQQVCADYFELKGHSYLSYVDRFSGWISVFHFAPYQATSDTLISECRSLFTAYGAPEEFASDGGPQFIAKKFENFLKDWGVHHRISSADYPQSNGRAELGVKAAKRMIHDNVLPNGSLNTDKAARAILQYRNTPCADIGISPAQILFHRQLRDHLPTHPDHFKLHPDWLATALKREQLLAERNLKLTNSYNIHASPLQPLAIRTSVAIQNQRRKNHLRWDKTGDIVEVLPNRQYRVRLHGSGRVVLRNRRFLRPYIHTDKLPIPSATVPSTNENLPPTNVTTEPTNTDTNDMQATQQLPRALRNLADYNQKGLRETEMPRRRNPPH